jgi:alpha-tubulin suppressor-like RCC1 family protein
MAELSGISTNLIDKVDGFFTTQGGGVSPDSVLAGAGTMVSFTFAAPWYPALDYEYNKRSYSSHSFSKLSASADFLVVWGIKSDGTLWFCAAENVSYFLAAIPLVDQDAEWHQYGTDTDWTDISSGRQCFGAIKGGAYYFLGRNNRYQEGNGSDATRTNWTLANNSLTWVQCALGEEQTVLRTSTGEVYTCGDNGSYATAQGTTAGYTIFLTREDNLLTNVTWVSSGNADSTAVIGGQVYFTGQNGGPHAGFQSTNQTDVNGFTAVNAAITDVISTHHQSRYSIIAVTTGGSIRFAGYASSKGRPDGGTASLTSATNQLSILTGAGTGWGFIFGTASDSSGSRYAGGGSKSGSMHIGGSVFTEQIQGLTNNNISNGDWSSLTNSGTPSAGSLGENLMVVSWR